MIRMFCPNVDAAKIAPLIDCSPFIAPESTGQPRCNVGPASPTLAQHCSEAGRTWHALLKHSWGGGEILLVL